MRSNPEDWKNLLDILNLRGKESPDQDSFQFPGQPSVTFGRFRAAVSAWASELRRKGLKECDRVLIALPNSPEFFYIFYAAMLAGGTAVPVFPGSGADRIFKLAQLSESSFICVSATMPQSKIARLKLLAKAKGINFLVLTKPLPRIQENLNPTIPPQRTAFIQFTSGSLGDPKGVQISHRSLVINIRQMIQGFSITDKDKFVSWLPVFHDMGLILMTMVPLYLGSKFFQLPSSIHYLSSWLKAIEKERGTFTAAPDFAYRMCLAYIADPENYDLSSLRVALNAAEPVRSSTIRRFEKTFRIKDILCPAYGLAEATVGVSGWRPGKTIRVDKQGCVSVGRPFPEVDCRIVPESQWGQPLLENTLGEIRFKSPSATSGYFHNPDATKKLFDDEGYLKTGDLGYLDGDGNLFVAGRKKNVIIHGGHTISAREIEEWADDLPQIRRSAALGIDRGGAAGEQVFLFLEARIKPGHGRNTGTAENLVREAVSRFHDVFGFRPGRIYILRPRSIPLTTNGKIRYSELKRLYFSNELKELDLILYPEF